MSTDIHALSGAYAVDALSDEERIDFEEHLAHCAACRDEVDSLRAAATLLGETVASAPSPSVRDAVLAGITEIRPLPPLTVAATPDNPDEYTDDLAARRTTRSRRWLTSLVAAAAAVVALGAGTVVWHPWETTTQVSLADQVLGAADAVSVTRRVEGAKLTLVRSESLGKAVLVTTDLPVLGSGEVYELWLQDPSGAMAPAGLLPSATTQTFLLDGDAATATAAGITVEPAGGSPAPTTTPLALFPFGKSA